MGIRRGRAGGGGSEKEARRHRWLWEPAWPSHQLEFTESVQSMEEALIQAGPEHRGHTGQLRLRNKDASSYQPRGTALQVRRAERAVQGCGKGAEETRISLRGWSL